MSITKMTWRTSSESERRRIARRNACVCEEMRVREELHLPDGNIYLAEELSLRHTKLADDERQQLSRQPILLSKSDESRYALWFRLDQHFLLPKRISPSFLPPPSFSLHFLLSFYKFLSFYFIFSLISLTFIEVFTISSGPICEHHIEFEHEQH